MRKDLWWLIVIACFANGFWFSLAPADVKPIIGSIGVWGGAITHTLATRNEGKQ
jgi:hypothetical protein